MIFDLTFDIQFAASSPKYSITCDFHMFKVSGENSLFAFLLADDVVNVVSLSGNVRYPFNQEL